MAESQNNTLLREIADDHEEEELYMTLPEKHTPSHSFDVITSTKHTTKTSHKYQ